MTRKTETAAQLKKTPARKKRDAARRRRQEARWAQRSGPVITRTMSQDERDRMG